MTIGIESEGKLLLITGDVHLYTEDRDVASKWASKYIHKNPALAWIIGRYAEADQANSNKQMWSLADVQATHGLIQNSPLNILHRPHHIVGSFVGTEVVYPTVDGAGDDSGHPYIEALAAFWKYYFPQELKVVEAAYNAGQLAYSMECVAEAVSCDGPDGCGVEFTYAGPQSKTYCAHLNDGISDKKMKNPLWLGGALIMPPSQPGWKDAKVSDMAHDIELADFVYASLQEEVPAGNPKVWEMQMLQILAQYGKKKKKKSGKKMMDEKFVPPWMKK